MKKIILLILLLNLSCAGRTSEKQKNVHQTSELLKASETAEKSTENKTAEKSEVKENTSEISQSEATKSESAKATVENNSSKNNVENSSKTEKRTEYYPNGNKKSESEKTENYSKLTDEKDYYKVSAESLKEDLQNSKKEAISYFQENKDLTVQNKALLESNSKYKSEIKSKDLQLAKKTERKSYPWYLLVAIGYFLKILVGFAWTKIKVSNPYLNLIAKIKTKLS